MVKLYIKSNCEKYWYKNNQIHRINGPAYLIDSYQYWYYNNEFVQCSNQKDFERIIRRMIFK